MMLLHLITITAIVSSVYAAPSSYQYVKFIRNSNSQTRSNSEYFNRQPRHFGTPFNLETSKPVELWRNYQDLPLASAVEIGRNGHITPDFSNGLGYPDPLLLTGFAAKRAINILYGKELFFSNIPHLRALDYNREERRLNGLGSHRYGSLRRESPYFRFKSSLPFF